MSSTKQYQRQRIASLQFHPKVDDRKNYWDALVKELFRAGLSAKAIQQIVPEVRGGVGRVYYRAKQFNVSSRDYRNGTSAAARQAIARVKADLSRSAFQYNSLKEALRQSKSNGQKGRKN